ncbi:MAG: hypothetical protein ACRC67_41650 [Inquilinus sp.]|uniref:hypothetical protein n=1 Tax=Inquilinus sp. TaxID=1932117 RepID=UPI003F3C6A8C
MATDPHPASNLEGFADKSPEDRRRAFMAMLREAEQEANRDGTVTLDEVLAEADRIIAEAEQRQRG